MNIVDACRLERCLQLGRAALRRSAWTACLLSIAALPSLGLAQTPDAATNQRILGELKGVRASLERLEKSHKALLALTKLQMDESRVATLQERRSRLSAQERDLTEKIAAANRAEAASVTTSAQAGGGTPEAAAQAEANLARSFSEQATRTLKEVTRSREELEQEIARLKERISATEKLFEDAMR